MKQIIDIETAPLAMFKAGTFVEAARNAELSAGLYDRLLKLYMEVPAFDELISLPASSYIPAPSVWAKYQPIRRKPELPFIFMPREDELTVTFEMIELSAERMREAWIEKFPEVQAFHKWATHGAKRSDFGTRW